MGIAYSRIVGPKKPRYFACQVFCTNLYMNMTHLGIVFQILQNGADGNKGCT